MQAYEIYSKLYKEELTQKQANQKKSHKKDHLERQAEIQKNNEYLERLRKVLQLDK